jgi:hypothetical protein
MPPRSWGKLKVLTDVDLVGAGLAGLVAVAVVVACVGGLDAFVTGVTPVRASVVP